mgnify:CR=1 FL=1
MWLSENTQPSRCSKLRTTLLFSATIWSTSWKLLSNRHTIKFCPRSTTIKTWVLMPANKDRKNWLKSLSKRMKGLREPRWASSLWMSSARPLRNGSRKLKGLWKMFQAILSKLKFQMWLRLGSTALQRVRFSSQTSKETLRLLKLWSEFNDSLLFPSILSRLLDYDEWN